MQFKAQQAQAYHIDRQAREQHTTQKCAADRGFAKVSGRLETSDGLYLSHYLLFFAIARKRILHRICFERLPIPIAVERIIFNRIVFGKITIVDAAAKRITSILATI